MRKIIALAVIGLAMAAPDALAQTGEKTADAEHPVTISAAYALTTINLSQKYHDSGSILSWRDIHLQGGQLNVEFNKVPSAFNKTNIGVGFYKSFHGYATDDDTNNGLNVISVSSTEALLLDLKYEMLFINNMFSPKLGLDFSFLKLDDYDVKSFYGSGSTIHKGLASRFDVYKFGYYVGMQMKIAAGVFYMNVSGQIGTGIYIVLADWILRTDFKHPISFYDIGFSLRGGGDLEVGLKFGRFTIFTKVLLSYDYSPFGTDNQFLSNDKEAMQFATFDLFRAGFNAGFKVSF